MAEIITSRKKPQPRSTRGKLNRARQYKVTEGQPKDISVTLMDMIFKSILKNYEKLNLIEFDIYRNNKLIGTHIFNFKNENEQLLVKSEIRFQIKKLGVILDLESGNEELGKDLAMHIAAAKPKAIDKTGVEAEIIETERRVAIEKAKEAGKPEDMITKIADGSINKFLKEVTLLNQTFVKDDKVTIDSLLKNNNATIHSFYIYIVGDGIEKKEEDFASEVAAASKG